MTRIDSMIWRKGWKMPKKVASVVCSCYELRLREAAELARDGGYEYFTTTLSISPMKNAQKLNEIGSKLAEEYGVEYLTVRFQEERTDISVLLSCQRNMDCTDRIIVDVYFPGMKRKRDTDKMQKKHRYGIRNA